MIEDKLLVIERELRRECLRQYLTSKDSTPDPIPGQFFPTKSDLVEELLRVGRMIYRLRGLYKAHKVNLDIKLDKISTNQSRKGSFGMPTVYGINGGGKNE